MKRLILIALIFIIYQNMIMAQKDFYIRVNQVGFAPGDIKTAIILSDTDLSSKYFYIVNAKSNKPEFEGRVFFSKGKYGEFNYSFELDFSEFNSLGEFFIKCEGQKSTSFRIGYSLYKKIPPKLLEFFPLQRCGYTNPIGHDICHIADATSLIKDGNVINSAYDVTGGWHDAGDYTKFLNTTAYTVYTMLFSYEFSPNKFNFDDNSNGVPDILEEAKIGLDWLLRCKYSDELFITQVQDMRDHDVGWRLPENDPLAFDRPGFLGNGKNLIGIYTAAMSLGAKIWRETIKYEDYAIELEFAAKSAFSVRNDVDDVDSSTTAYTDKEFEGKLALGAFELYNLTGEQSYLRESMRLAEQAGSDQWWSWGNINAYVHYRLGRFDKKFIKFLEGNLLAFKEKSDSTIFNEGVPHSWGTNNTILGITLQAILYKSITKSTEFDKLALQQRDYILGMNPWGLSFFTGIGKNYSKNLHHQISYLNKLELPGGFAAGPIIKSVLESAKIPFMLEDNYEEFQSDEAFYRDDVADYISNEPTITANATALFVMGYFSR